jgi:hypothetical protein
VLNPSARPLQELRDVFDIYTIIFLALAVFIFLRLRSVLDTLTREYSGQDVLIVGHQVIVNCFRYLFERMTETEVLGIDREADVPNCGVTYYEFDPAQGTKGKLVLRFANFVAPLVEGGAPVTSAPDVPAAPKS